MTFWHGVILGFIAGALTPLGRGLLLALWKTLSSRR
jgi:hypothetical protein